MSEEEKKHLDDKCDKIDFMRIVQSIGSQIKVSTIDTQVLNSKFFIHLSCKMFSFRTYPYSPYRMDSNFLGGGVGVSVRIKNLKKCMKLNRNFQRGGAKL